ncbi:bZIP transcription factor [Ceratobasidium sp. AG-Ba]|nr:bZIP transcription factor [Ceratobasidium sp. AG-Ba]
MSSRGRKRNDNLPPSRAREVQRAFRARRKQHLAALEERIDILETENARLRQMLALPPSDRQPLGRGPTGREPPRRVSTPAASGSAPGAAGTPSMGIDLTVTDPNADPVPAASPPPLSPGQPGPGRSPSGNSWPPPLQPPPGEWPLQHPPGPSSGVRAPSPYGQHLGTYGSFLSAGRVTSVW